MTSYDCPVKVVVEAEFDYHLNNVYGVVYFPPNIIVTVSHGRRVIICDIEERCKIDTLEFASAIQSVVKFSSNSFLISSGNAIRGYIFEENNKCIDFFSMLLGRERDSSIVYGLLKLETNLILASVDSDEFGLCVIDVEKSKVLKRLGKLSTFYNFFGLILSNLDKKVFFISTSEVLNDIRKIDYVSGKTLLKFDSGNNRVYYLDSFIDYRMREILAASRQDSCVCLYDSHNGEIILKVETLEAPWSCTVLNPTGLNNYLLVGGENGNLEIFSFKTSEFENILLKVGFHEQAINEIEVLEKQKYRVKICTVSDCSSSGQVSVRISSLFSALLVDEDIDHDEIERIEYLKEFYFDEFVVKILSKNVVIVTGKILL